MRSNRARTAALLTIGVGSLVAIGLWVAQPDQPDLAAGPDAELVTGVDPAPDADPDPTTAPGTGTQAESTPAPVPAEQTQDAGPLEPPTPPQAATAGSAPGSSATEIQLPPVALDATADFGNAVTASLTQVDRVDGQGQGLGERDGPALAVSVEMTNDSAETVDLDYVVVNLYAPDGAPGSTLSGDPRSQPFSGLLAPGESRTAVYVIRIPATAAGSATVTVSYGAAVPTVVFTGEVPT